jgi:hypothetical protein
MSFASIIVYVVPQLVNIMLELIIINYNMYGLIYNEYILYNGLSNYIHNEVIKFCIGFIICHEKWAL